MNTASLENCKRLYELSGWKANYAWYYYEVGGTKLEPVVGDMHKPGNGYMEMYAYDLGFLLRKLPRSLEAEGESFYEADFFLGIGGGETWHTGYRIGAAQAKISVTANTPEDAACLLAIELFKQKVITP